MSVIKIDHTADEFRAMARASRKSSEDSFERSDTDGFLSQWASDTMARAYDLAATLAESNGRYDFEGLVDLTGNPVPCKIVETRYGPKWLVTSAWDERGQPTGDAVAWLSIPRRDVQDDGTIVWNKRSIATLRSKGYQLAYIWRDAVLVSRSSGGYSVTYVPIPAWGKAPTAADVEEIVA
jgi:hypothetical protein